MTERHEKTHHECKCPECDATAAMMVRLDAWTAAYNALQNGNWREDDKPTISDTLVLAAWLVQDTNISVGARMSED